MHKKAGKRGGRGEPGLSALGVRRKEERGRSGEPKVSLGLNAGLVGLAGERDRRLSRPGLARVCETVLRTVRKPCQRPYKPGSVLGVSLQWATIPLGCVLPRTSSNQPAHSRPDQACSFRSAMRLFGLAPGGVCRADPVARGAVRSCRTLSTLPETCRSVRRSAFCCTVPDPGLWSRGRRALPATVDPWSPDFPRHPFG